jgi:hypothetical protein
MSGFGDVGIHISCRALNPALDRQPCHPARLMAQSDRLEITLESDNLA